MALSNLLLSKASQPGLWLIKSRNSIIDICQLVFDLAFMGSMFLEIYSSDKERIVNMVISMIIKDRLHDASDPSERVIIENDISAYHERGCFCSLTELNDFLIESEFWERQVWIYDYDPLFVENSSRNTIIVDYVNKFNKYNEASFANFLRQTNRLALREKKSVFMFMNEYTSDFSGEFIRKRLINP